MSMTTGRVHFRLLYAGILLCGCYPGDPYCESYFTSACVEELGCADESCAIGDPGPGDPFGDPLAPLPGPDVDPNEIVVTGCRWPLIEVNGQCVDPDQAFPPGPGPGPGNPPDPGGGPGDPPPPPPPAEPEPPKPDEFPCGPPQLLAFTPDQRQSGLFFSWEVYRNYLALALWSIHQGDLAEEAQDPIMQTALQVLSDYVFSGGVVGVLTVTDGDFEVCLSTASCRTALRQYYRSNLSALTATRCDLDRPPQHPPTFAGGDIP